MPKTKEDISKNISELMEMAKDLPIREGRTDYRGDASSVLEDALRKNVSEETLATAVERFSIEPSGFYTEEERAYMLQTFVDNVCKGRSDEELNVFLRSERALQYGLINNVYDHGGNAEQAKTYSGDNFRPVTSERAREYSEADYGLSDDEMRELFGGLYGTDKNADLAILHSNMDRFTAEAAKAFVESVDKTCTDPENVGRMSDIVCDMTDHGEGVASDSMETALCSTLEGYTLSDGTDISSLLKKVCDTMENPEKSNSISTTYLSGMWTEYRSNLMHEAGYDAREIFLSNTRECEHPGDVSVIFGYQTTAIISEVRYGTPESLKELLENTSSATEHKWSDEDIVMLFDDISKELALQEKIGNGTLILSVDTLNLSADIIDTAENLSEQDKKELKEMVFSTAGRDDCISCRAALGTHLYDIINDNGQYVDVGRAKEEAARIITKKAPEDYPDLYACYADVIDYSQPEDFSSYEEQFANEDNALGIFFGLGAFNSLAKLGDVLLAVPPEARDDVLESFLEKYDDPVFRKSLVKGIQEQMFTDLECEEVSVAEPVKDAPDAGDDHDEI